MIPKITVKLTPKQEKFCQFYIELGNASEAYRQAYHTKNMKPETVNRKAKELLDNGKITARTEELREHHFKKHEMTVEKVLGQLVNLGFSNIKQIYDENGSFKKITEMPDELAAAIQSVELGTNGEILKLKLVDKKGPVELIGKHLKMFTTILEHSGTDGGPIETKEVGNIELARRIAYVLRKGLKAKKQQEKSD